MIHSPFPNYNICILNSSPLAWVSIHRGLQELWKFLQFFFFPTTTLPLIFQITASKYRVRRAGIVFACIFQPQTALYSGLIYTTGQRLRVLPNLLFNTAHPDTTCKRETLNNEVFTLPFSPEELRALDLWANSDLAPQAKAFIKRTTDMKFWLHVSFIIVNIDLEQVDWVSEAQIKTSFSIISSLVSYSVERNDDNSK